MPTFGMFTFPTEYLVQPAGVAQAIEERARREVHHHHFGGFAEHPVGHGFADADAGDLKHLVIEAVHPFAPKLDVVPARNYREIVTDLRAPKNLVNFRPKEERIAETEGGSKSDRRISGDI